MSKPYTLSDLIDDLEAIRAEHGDSVPVTDGNGSPLFARHLDIVKWSDGDESGIRLEIGRRR